MTTLAILGELPSGYAVEETPRAILAMSIPLARRLHEAGYGPESDGPMEPSDLSGRRPLFQIELEGQRFVVRRYHRGGLLRWFFPRRSLEPERPFRELVLADALARSGIRTPEVIAAKVVRWGGGGALGALSFGWALELVSRRVDNAVDLAEVLEAIREGRVAPAARARLFRATGAAVRALHRVGFLHADLNPRNVLVRREALDSAEPEPWVIDLDRSVFVEKLSDAERRNNLRRLYRSLRRRERRGTPFLTRTDFARFLRRYDPEGKTWKADWRAIEAGHARSVPLHALGWFLERVFGDGVEKRDGRAVVRS